MERGHVGILVQSTVMYRKRGTSKKILYFLFDGENREICVID